MKIIIKYLFIIISLLLISMTSTTAKENVNLYLFYGEGCPHCANEIKYLNTIKKEFTNLNIIKYEVWYNDENKKLLDKISSNTNKNLSAVPVTIIGETIITGFSTGVEQQLVRAINYYSKNDYHDIVLEIKNNIYDNDIIKEKEFLKIEQELNKETTINLPFSKEINFKNYELSNATTMLGILTTITYPILLLFLLLVAIINFIPEKKEKLKMLIITIIIINIISSLIIIFNFNKINYLGKISIFLLCLITLLYKINNKKINIKLLILLFTIFISLVVSPTYYNVLKTLVNNNLVSNTKQIIYNFYYFLSYFLANIFIIIVYELLFSKISEKLKKITIMGICLLTMILIIVY